MGICWVFCGDLGSILWPGFMNGAASPERTTYGRTATTNYPTFVSGV